ncbi:MAG: glycosyltransferase family 9 protein [Leptospirales bacterium]|nr:glycosyltransferase family 9 protein [Leptospirales bacterium]
MSVFSRILIVRTGALGDLILTSGVIERIRKGNPDAHITIAGNVEFLPLVQNYVDSIISFESPMLRPYFLRDECKPGKEDSANLGAPEDRLPFDLAYVWLKDINDPFIQNLRRSGIKVFAAPSFQTNGEIHQAAFLSKILDQDPAMHNLSGSTADRVTGRLTLRLPNASEILESRGPGTHRIAIHSGAGSMRKRWPLERFQALARLLQQNRNADVYWIVGPAEFEHGSASAADLPVGHVVRSDIVPLAYFLRTIDLFVGNDSGVTHLARALGIETIALFGPTDPTIWAPQGARVLHCAGPDGRPDASVQDVLDLASGLLSMKVHDTHR